MVGSEGRAIGVEHIPELVASSIKNIEASAAASPLLKQGSLAIHVGGEVSVPKVCLVFSLKKKKNNEMFVCFKNRWKARMG